MQSVTSGHSVKTCMAAAAVLLTCGTVRSAETNYWLGANTATGTSAKTLIDDITNWSLNRVPGVGNDDLAWFAFYNGLNEADLYIAATNLFAPSSIVFEACTGDKNYDSDKDIYLDKSLTLERLVCMAYPSSGGSGTLFPDRFRIGTMTTSNITVSLTGDGNALDMTTRNANPAFVRLGSGVGNVLLDFKGTNILFSRGQQMKRDYLDNMGGGALTENVGNTLNSTVRFSTPGASIDLEDQGLHLSNLGLGYHNFEVRSDQVWTADPTAYVRFIARNKHASGSAPLIVKSIDGGRLDNLDQINLVVSRSDTSSMSIPGGTYGSLNLSGGNTANRDAFFTLLADVRFAGNAVIPPTSTIPAYTNEYSVMLRSFSGGMSKWYLMANGHDLAMANGLWLYDETGSSCIVDAIGSTVTIGGNIKIESRYDAWIVTNGTSTANRNLGIRGDAATVFSLKGNYETKCRSYYNSNNTLNKNFSVSTVELIGGTGVKTFEVGDAETLTGVQKNSFSIGTLKVGNETEVGNVKLVNNSLNDNPVTLTNALDLVGEKLIVETLSVGSRSRLNVNAQCVEVGSSLMIADGGILDLGGIGETIPGRIRVDYFQGLGDQAAVWNSLGVGKVLDSTNRGAKFIAVYDALEDRTYWEGSLKVTLVIIR